MPRLRQSVALEALYTEPLIIAEKVPGTCEMLSKSFASNL